MSDESDLELKSNLKPKTNVQVHESPTEGLLKKDKKLTTKTMLQEALMNLKSRKGVSLYAIKKYMSMTYDFDSEKMGYLLKRQIISGVEDGSIVQVKGNGASGSFKLVSNKKNPEKKENKMKKPKKMEIVDAKTSKPVRDDAKAKPKSLKSKQTAKNEAMQPGTSQENVEIVTKKITKPKKTTTKSENATSSKEEIKKSSKTINKDKHMTSEGKKSKNKMASVLKTPAKKKAAMMKRKSIGSIIKTPRMKPRAK